MSIGDPKAACISGLVEPKSIDDPNIKSDYSANAENVSYEVRRLGQTLSGQYQIEFSI